ncbi:MAG: PIG-L family deacetylase [Planctomycetota bacterium]
MLLAPHADDDIIGAGGTCAQHVAQGDPVRVIVAYSGEAGDPDGRFPAEEYAALRQREARAGGKHLGFDDYHFLGHPEGHEPSPTELLAAAEQLAEHVRAFAPDIVYAPWIGEHHLDHHVAARVMRVALQLADFQGAAWGYEVWSALVPEWVNDVTSLYDAKAAALREHTSQLSYQDLIHKALALMAQRSIYVTPECRYAEGFAPLGPATPEDAGLVEEGA